MRATRAEGVYIYDDAGRRYLDGSSGPLAANLGHGVPEILAAMERQLHLMTFAHGSEFTSEAQERAADLLVTFAPPGLSRVFFVSGGSEATETAIKLARQYWVDAGTPTKYKIIGKRASYHGATLGALSASGFAARRGPYEPLLLPFPQIPEVHCRRCPFGLEYGRCRIEGSSGRASRRRWPRGETGVAKHAVRSGQRRGGDHPSAASCRRRR
ncbi:MAG TPA: aminotransferase class III-fold pyridoxal phosphate-dependent enzyme, partial [bacterium]|nr:aminotransferase class III-fold pyridoxal phosphate-dependent enzyme [bacterium]